MQSKITIAISHVIMSEMYMYKCICMCMHVEQIGSSDYRGLEPIDGKVAFALPIIRLQCKTMFVSNKKIV